MMNIQLINCNIFQQKVVDPLPPDKQVRKALQKKGYPPKAPKNLCGCKHYALSDMKTLSDTDVRFYTQSESKKDFSNTNVRIRDVKMEFWGRIGQ